MNLPRTVRIIILVLVIAPIAILVFGGVVMLLWNNVAVPVLHVSEITFWQALGILVLSKILFGSFSGKSGSERYYQKQKIMWRNMTPEQREKFKEEWRSRRNRWGRSSEAEINTEA